MLLPQTTNSEIQHSIINNQQCTRRRHGTRI